MREIYSTGAIAAQYGSLGLRSEKYIITSQHEDLVHLVLFLLDTELPGYGCWLAVDDLDGEHAGLSCCVGKRIVPGKFWALLPRQLCTNCLDSAWVYRMNVLHLLVWWQSQARVNLLEHAVSPSFRTKRELKEGAPIRCIMVNIICPT